MCAPLRRSLTQARLREQWFMDKFNHDLPFVARLGCPLALWKGTPPGVSSTHAVIHIVEKTAEKSDMVNIIVNARVAALNMIGGACAECIYV